MNWQTKWNISGLLSAALTLLLFSCNNDDAGLVLDDEPPAGTYFTDTITVESSVFLITEDIETSAYDHILAGVYQSSYTGTVQAQAFSQLTPQTTIPDLSGAVADSATLFLDYVYYAGDTTAQQKFTVYPLTSDLDKNTTYLATSPAPAYDAANPAGSLSFQARPNLEQHVKVPIDPDFAGNMLQAAAAGNFSAAIKGIAVIPDVSMPGAVLGFNMLPDISVIKVYYHTPAEDSLVFTAKVSNEGARFYRIEGDRSASDFAALASEYDSVSTGQTNNLGILQAGTGLQTRLSFPYIDELRKQFGDILVNKAEIILPVKENVTKGLGHVGTIILYEADSTGRIREVSGVRKLVQSGFNQDGTVSPLIIPYSSDTKQYKIPFTSYMSELVYGGRPEEGIFVSPTADVTGYIDLNEATVNQSVLPDQNFAGDGMKLKLYFSIIP